MSLIHREVPEFTLWAYADNNFKQVSKQDIVFHEPHGILLIHQTGRRVAGICSVG